MKARTPAATTAMMAITYSTTRIERSSTSESVVVIGAWRIIDITPVSVGVGAPVICGASGPVVVSLVDERRREGGGSSMSSTAWGWICRTDRYLDRSALSRSLHVRETGGRRCREATGCEAPATAWSASDRLAFGSAG